MLGDKIKPGSSFLFGLIRIFIGIFSLSAVALVAMGIWLWTQLDKFSWPEIVFITFGVFELALVVLGCTAQTSKGKLRCFLLIIGVLFLAELTVAIIVYATGDKIIKEVIDQTKSQEEYDKLYEQFHNYLFYVNAVVIATITIQLMLILMVKCYIGSLRERNAEYDYKFVDDEGNKLTVGQKQLSDRKNIEEKYSKKREEMYEKYGRPAS